MAKQTYQSMIAEDLREIGILLMVFGQSPAPLKTKSRAKNSLISTAKCRANFMPMADFWQTVRLTFLGN